MSAHVLLNLLNELGKEIKCEACRAFYLFFATSLINSKIKSTNDRFYLSYDRYFEISFLALKHYNFVIMCTTLLWTS